MVSYKYSKTLFVSKTDGLEGTAEVYAIMSVRKKEIRDRWFIFFQDSKVVQVKYGEIKCKTEKGILHAEENGRVELLSKRWCACQKFKE